MLAQQNAVNDIQSFDILILALRIAFIGLLYFFIFVVVRVIMRELSTPVRTARPPAEVYYPPAANFNPANPTTGGKLVVTEIGSATTVARGDIFALSPLTPIGRRGNNAIVLDDNYISSEHALVALREGRWWLSDIASTNGTFLNGQQVVQPYPLKFGDLIEVGGVRIRFEP